MKCRVQTKLSAPDMAAAIDAAKKMMDAQSDVVAARCYNEMAVAMLQCNLSAKTIDRVQRTLAQAVLPYLDRLYVPDKKAKDNLQNIQDADIWVADYLKSHGVEPMTARKQDE